MKLVCLMLLIVCFKESQSRIRTFYPPFGSGLSFLCGCVSSRQYNKNIPIKCKNGQVIQMEPSGYLMRNSFGNSSYCGNLNYTTCKIFRPTVINLKDRIEVYKKCSLQNSCDIKIAGEQEGTARLVIYPFYCHSAHDLSKQVSKSNNPYLYFSGEKYKGQKINCDCSASSSGPIRLEMYFIHLKPRTCSKVKFLSQTHQIFGCSTNVTTLLYNEMYIGRDFKLEIRGLEPDEEDVIFFRLLGTNMTVKCGGCTSADAVVTTIRPQATNPSTTTPQASSDPDSSTIDATTIDIPTTTPLATSDTDSSNRERTTTEDSALDGSAPAASTDQTNSTTILGGILAAVIIINIIGISLYCVLRRRRKQEKSRNTLANTSGNGDTHGPNYTNSTYSNVSQNGEQGISSDSIESISKTSGYNDRPNNQYHVLEVDTYSEPANTCGDTGAKQKRGRQQDDYDHINDGSKSKPTNNDTYNHIDSTVNTTSLSDDYNHIGDQNGLSKGKLELIGVAEKKQKRKPKNQVSGQENTSYVNVNLETDEAPPNSEDVDTYNHLQN